MLTYNLWWHRPTHYEFYGVFILRLKSVNAVWSTRNRMGNTQNVMQDYHQNGNEKSASFRWMPPKNIFKIIFIKHFQAIKVTVFLGNHFLDNQMRVHTKSHATIAIPYVFTLTRARENWMQKQQQLIAAQLYANCARIYQIAKMHQSRNYIVRIM